MIRFMLTLATVFAALQTSQAQVRDSIHEKARQLQRFYESTDQQGRQLMALKSDAMSLLIQVRSNHARHVAQEPLYQGAFCYDFSEAAYLARVQDMDDIIWIVIRLSNAYTNTYEQVRVFGVFPRFSISFPLVSMYTSDRRFAFTTWSIYLNLPPDATFQQQNDMEDSLNRASMQIRALETTLTNCIADMRVLYDNAAASVQEEEECWQAFQLAHQRPGVVGPPVVSPLFP